MGEAEVTQFESWVDQLAAADDPLDVWYEHIWAPDIDHRAIEGAPDDVGPIIGRAAPASGTLWAIARWSCGRRG